MKSWTLVYEAFDPEKESLREALCTLGNGYFATRGAAPESEAGEVHYPGTYLAGGYNRLKTEIAGRVIENEDLVNIPNWLVTRFRPEAGDWLNLLSVDILFYRQELDLKTGLLSRTVTFKDRENRETTLIQRRFVHMEQMHLAALETTIIPENWSGRLEVLSGIDGTVINAGVERYKQLNSKHLSPIRGEAVDDETICLLVETNQSGLRVAEAARTRVYSEEQLLEMERKPVEQPGFIALIAMLSLSQIMVHAGMIAGLSAWAAQKAGGLWPLLCPLVGVLGTFVTGSATASNILFTDFQQTVAQNLGLPVLAMVGAQGFGAAAGNIICPHNIVAGSATVGLAGKEGSILKKTMVGCLVYSALGGLVALGLARFQ